MDFDTEERMQLWKSINMWDATEEELESPFNNEPDPREEEMHEAAAPVITEIE